MSLIPDFTNPHDRDVMHAMLTSTVRFWNGVSTRPARRKPEQLLALYEYEGHADCRLVREVLTELDIDAQIYPCPEGGLRFQTQMIRQTETMAVPALVDPNTDKVFVGATAIITYLYEMYALEYVPLKWSRLKTLNTLTSVASGYVRGGRGVKAASSKPVADPLELWSFESSPYARPVRERLSELEIPYILHSTGRSTWQDWLLPEVRAVVAPNYTPEHEGRKALLARTGKVSIPFLVDPNTGIEMFESDEILAYLEETYAL